MEYLLYFCFCFKYQKGKSLFISAAAGGTLRSWVRRVGERGGAGEEAEGAEPGGRSFGGAQGCCKQSTQGASRRVE